MSSALAGLSISTDGADVAEAGADAIVDGEEAAQIEPAFDLHGDMVQGDAETLGIEAIGDLLAGAERGQHQLDGVGAGIAAAERLGLVEGQAEIADRAPRCAGPSAGGSPRRRLRRASVGCCRKLLWVVVKMSFRFGSHRALHSLSRAGPHDG